MNSVCIMIITRIYMNAAVCGFMMLRTLRLTLLYLEIHFKALSY